MFICGALLCTSTLPAFAAPPDAGQLLREQQPQRQLPQQLPKPEVEKERPTLADTGVRIDVKGFRFSGYAGLIPEDELQSVVADSIGKQLSFSELQGVAASVTALLKENGWFLARAYLPKQDVTSGIIEIIIIQGKSDGSLTIKRSPTARISEETLQGIGETAVLPGQPLNEKQLERSVLLMNDLPGVNARASLAAGATPGSTGVQIDVNEDPLLGGAVWGDNQGNRYTGAWRGNGMVNVNDPFRYGDQLSLLMIDSEGLTEGRAAYFFPLTSGGLKGNLSYTGMRYELIKDLASLNAEGKSHTANAGISYPLLRTRTTNVTTALNYEFNNLTDSSNNVDIRETNLNSGTFSVSGDRYDTLLGGGYTSWKTGATTGNMQESIADIAITKTEGGFTSFNLGVSRLQRLAERSSINLSWSSQLSLDNLDSSEKFNLGGPYGVRAYPVGEASGDEGHLFNIDLRYDLPVPETIGAIQLNGFYDAGYITLHKHLWDNAVATATNENSYWLQGAGVGLNYSYSNRVSLRGIWAHVIGDNPGRSAGGNDADGRSDENRFWLQCLMYF
jgi:hemolysin activation/secretion protein